MDDKRLVDGSLRFVDIRSGSQGQLTIDYRLLSPALFVNKVKFQFVHTISAGGKSKQLLDETFEPPRTHDDPFVWRATRSLRGGAGKLKVRITVGDTPKLEDEIDLSTPLSAAQGSIQRGPPRLVVDIDELPRSSPNIDSLSEPKKLVAILERIARSLPRGLDDTAWLGPTSGRGLTIDEMSLSTEAKKEERWARRVSEMMILTPYFLPSTLYGTSDRRMYDRMAARLEAGAEAFYPMIAECQQLCTTIAMSRGVKRELLGGGLNSGGSQGLPLFKDGNGEFFFDSKLLKASNALSATPLVGPGSVYQYNDKVLGPNKGSAHIGTILRVQTGPWKALQPLDTGGLNSPERGKGVRLTKTEGGLGGGIFDDPWVTSIPGPGEDFTGLGIISTKHTPPANLSRWWPCGFVRLMIRRRDGGQLLYATPLLRMHDANRDYPYSVLANALRGVPGTEEFEPQWQISGPRQALSKDVMEKPRETTARALLSPSGVSVDRPLSNNVEHLFLIANITALADGLVLKADLKKDKNKNTVPDRLPWGVRSGSLASAIPLSDVPAYLRGDET